MAADEGGGGFVNGFAVRGHGVFLAGSGGVLGL